MEDLVDVVNTVPPATDNEPDEIPLPISILSKLAEYIYNKDTL